jgi:hypothetical protein
LLYTGIDLGMAFGSLLFGIITDTFKSYTVIYLMYAVFEILAVWIFIYRTTPSYRMFKEQNFIKNSQL